MDILYQFTSFVKQIATIFKWIDFVVIVHLRERDYIKKISALLHRNLILIAILLSKTNRNVIRIRFENIKVEIENILKTSLFLLMFRSYVMTLYVSNQHNYNNSPVMIRMFLPEYVVSSLHCSLCPSFQSPL